MGEKRFCVICDKDVEIGKVIPHEDYDEQVLSCGHFGRRINRSMPIEKVSLEDKFKALAIRFRSLKEGPIIVSDASGTSVASGSFQATVVNGNITAGTVNFNNTYKLEINNSTAINHLNIQNILSMIDSNNSYTSEEKEQIKGEVSKAEKILKSIGTVSDRAAPYVQLLISLLQKTG